MDSIARAIAGAAILFAGVTITLFVGPYTYAAYTLTIVGWSLDVLGFLALLRVLLILPKPDTSPPARAPFPPAA
jgi:hypothetical protein